MCCIIINGVSKLSLSGTLENNVSTSKQINKKQIIIIKKVNVNEKM